MNASLGMINENFFKPHQYEMTRYKLRNKSLSETLNISQPSFIPNNSMTDQMAHLGMTNSSICHTSCASPTEISNDSTLAKSFYINLSSSIILNKMTSTLVQSSPMINKYDQIKSRTRIPVLPLIRIKPHDYNLSKQTSILNNLETNCNKSNDYEMANNVKEKCSDVKSNNVLKKKLSMRKAVRHVTTKYMRKSGIKTSTPFKIQNRSTNMVTSMNTGRNLTFSNQLQNAKINGIIELQNPHSILGKTNLKGLINLTNWRTLQSMGCDMTHLLSQLPPPDALAMSFDHNNLGTSTSSQKAYVPSVNSALNNEFLSSALVQWKTHLIRGEYKPKVPRQKRILISRVSKKITKTIKKTTLKAKHKVKKNNSNHVKKGVKKGSPPIEKSPGSELVPLRNVTSCHSSTSTKLEVGPLQSAGNAVILPQTLKYPHTSPIHTTQTTKDIITQPEPKPKIGIIIRNNACQLMAKDGGEEKENGSLPLAQFKREKEVPCHRKPDIPLLLPFIHPTSPPCNKLNAIPKPNTTSSTIALAPSPPVLVNKALTTPSPPPPLLLPIPNPMNYERTKLPKHHKGPEFVIIPATMPNSCKFILRIKTATDTSIPQRNQHTPTASKPLNCTPKASSAYQFILPKPTATPSRADNHYQPTNPILKPVIYSLEQLSKNKKKHSGPAVVLSSCDTVPLPEPTLAALPPLRLNHPLPANMYERFLSDLDPELKRNFLASVAHTLQKGEPNGPSSGPHIKIESESSSHEMPIVDNAAESVSKLFRLREQLNLTRLPLPTSKINHDIPKLITRNLDAFTSINNLTFNNGTLFKERSEHSCSTSTHAMVKCSNCGAFNHKQCPAPSLDRRNGDLLKPKIATRASAHKCNNCGQIF